MPLISDKTAKITNRWYDGGGDADHEQTTSLVGVSWYGQTVAQVGTDGLHAASIYKMRVFAETTTAITPDGSSRSVEASYLPSTEWRALSAADRPSHWTLQPGDTVVCGDTIATVLSVHDNRGSRQFPHLYVEAK